MTRSDGDVAMLMLKELECARVSGFFFASQCGNNRGCRMSLDIETWGMWPRIKMEVDEISDHACALAGV
jgi:hypothetical protein